MLFKWWQNGPFRLFGEPSLRQQVRRCLKMSCIAILVVLLQRCDCQSFCVIIYYQFYLTACVHFYCAPCIAGCMHCMQRGLATLCLSVCLSVKRVIYDKKTKDSCARIHHESSLILV